MVSGDGWNRCDGFGRYQKDHVNIVDYYCQYVWTDHDGNDIYDLHEFID